MNKGKYQKSGTRTRSVPSFAESEGIHLEQPVFKRVVLKVSGESLAGQNGYGIDADMIISIAEQIKEVVELGVQVAIVCGGGTFGAGSRAAQAA